MITRLITIMVRTSAKTKPVDGAYDRLRSCCLVCLYLMNERIKTTDPTPTRIVPIVNDSMP
jgi:hypothetical protein